MGFNPIKSKLVYEETATLNLVDPVTGIELEDNGEPISITVYGQASPKHLQAVNAMMQSAAKRGKREATLAERKAESINFLTAISVSASNLDYNDAPVESKEQFKEMYANDSISWIRDQVAAFAGESGSFMSK